MNIISKFGIANVTYIPVRNKPSESAEMITQIVFGEQYKVLEQEGNWICIQCIYDGYVGWVDIKYYYESTNEGRVINRYVGRISHENAMIFISPGCEITLEQMNRVEVLSNNNDSIESIAKSFLNTPYLWGGRTFMGIDCSGFIQMVFKVLNIKLLRDASQQAKQGVNVDELRCGDLAFFGKDEKKITHVGILLNESEIIHASGKVRIDDFNTEGIINRITGKITHDFLYAKRYF